MQQHNRRQQADDNVSLQRDSFQQVFTLLQPEDDRQGATTSVSVPAENIVLAAAPAVSQSAASDTNTGGWAVIVTSCQRQSFETVSFSSE